MKQVFRPTTEGRMIKIMSGRLTKEEAYLFGTGKYYHSYLKFGAHLCTEEGKTGVMFTVWAPDVKSVHVVGNFNDWTPGRNRMRSLGDSGIWQLFIPYLGEGEVYKYHIETADGRQFLKADPYAFMAQRRPETASVVFDTNWYDWQDREWMRERRKKDFRTEPMNIYEVHLGSWKRRGPEDFYSYAELADMLVPYVKEMGYTHVEFLPVMEHPLDASWGYQVTGYFAPTARYGDPKGLMHLIDRMHCEGISVILDWVPAHFCKDEQGLGRFNGAMLFEADEHKHWGTYKFDFGRPQVRSFLISNALYWLDVYHADGIRVDGVSSMLYMNYCGDHPERRNRLGGTEDLDAIAFLQELTDKVREYHPEVFMAAEEATAFAGVTKKAQQGGLGFDYKWNMGWMNDTLRYVEKDHIFRKYHHQLLNFSMMYHYDEKFILPLSHDEVVHGKKSLIGKMPGDYWRKFAGLRLLMFYLMTHPGGKLSFMGSEIGQFIEWREYEGLEWFLLGYDMHRNYHEFVRELNHFYTETPELFEMDPDPRGFSWIDADNADQSILVYERFAKDGSRITAILNFTPATYENFRIGAEKGEYEEVFNTDELRFGGSGKVNRDLLLAEETPWQNRMYSVTLTIPPLGGVILRKKEKTIGLQDDKALETEKETVKAKK